jgi:hypothetical protein
LWGKKVYDAEGHLLGEVVAVSSRRGVVHKVVIRRVAADRPMRLTPPADAQVDRGIIRLPPQPTAGRPQLRLVH